MWKQSLQNLSPEAVAEQHFSKLFFHNVLALHSSIIAVLKADKIGEFIGQRHVMSSKVHRAKESGIFPYREKWILLAAVSRFLIF